MLSFITRYESYRRTLIRWGRLQSGSLTEVGRVEKASWAPDSDQVYYFLITKFRISFCRHFSLGHERRRWSILLTADTSSALSWRITGQRLLSWLFWEGPIPLNLLHEFFMGRLSLFHGYHRPRHNLRVRSDGRIPHTLPGLIIGPAYQGATWLLSKLSVKFGLEI